MPFAQESVNVGECASVACAIGWTPLVFPELVKWRRRSLRCSPDNFYGDFNVEYIKDPSISGYVDVAMKLFNLEHDTALGLFTPGRQKFISDHHLRNVGSGASPKRVAKMLREFLELEDERTRKK